MRRLFVLSFKLYACIVVSLSIAGCNKKPGSDTTGISFSNTAIGYPLTVFINEASGIADSKINPGHLWVEEDSGNPPQLYLLDHTAATVKKIYIKDATNIDWEDIALASGPDASKKYLYIADIGDNNAVRASAVFYRLEEPAASTDTVRTYEVINFIYADGPRDAEAFLVDDITKDIYIISKRDAKSKLYKLSYPYSTASLNTAIFVETLPYNGVVSAAASNDGKSLIIKTYPALYYYTRTAGETIAQSIQKDFTRLNYQLEPQGEAACFALDNTGFYTLSEKANGYAQSLYFYKKN